MGLPVVKLFVLLGLLTPRDIPKVEAVSHPDYHHISQDFNHDVYDAAHGPTAWPGVCSTGLFQSPIDVRVRVPDAVTKFYFSPNYAATQKGFFSINPGYTYKVQLNKEKSNPKSSLTFGGAGLKSKYIFSQLHFHWGFWNKGGSEHTLDGRSFPMEMHLVHFKVGYNNLSEALAASPRDPEAVHVLAVFLEVGETNPALEPIVQSASYPALREASNVIHFNYKKLNLVDLLPNKLDFARYLGSLTTPPCTEKVTWTVFVNPIWVSESQIRTFQSLRNLEDTEYSNFRPTQPLNNREVRFYLAYKPGYLVRRSSEAVTPDSSTVSLMQYLGGTIKEADSILSKFLINLCALNECDENDMRFALQHIKKKQRSLQNRIRPKPSSSREMSRFKNTIEEKPLSLYKYKGVELRDQPMTGLALRSNYDFVQDLMRWKNDQVAHVSRPSYEYVRHRVKPFRHHREYYHKPYVRYHTPVRAQVKYLPDDDYYDDEDDSYYRSYNSRRLRY